MGDKVIIGDQGIYVEETIVPQEHFKWKYRPSYDGVQKGHSSSTLMISK